MFKSLVAGVVAVIAALFGMHGASLTPTISYNRANPPAQLAASAAATAGEMATSTTSQFQDLPNSGSSTIPSSTNNITQQLPDLSSYVPIPSNSIPSATIAKAPTGYLVSAPLAQQTGSPFTGYATLADLASTSAALQSEIASLGNPIAAAQVSQQVAAGGNAENPLAAAQAINNLSGVTITNASLTGSEIPDLSGKYLSLDGGRTDMAITVFVATVVVNGAGSAFASIMSGGWSPNASPAADRLGAAAAIG